MVEQRSRRLFSDLFITLLFLALSILAGCAGQRLAPGSEQQTVTVQAGENAGDRPIPVFTLHDTQYGANRIGTVEAAIAGGQSAVGINSAFPTFYTATKAFTTERGSYINHIYRVHFERTPHSLFPFHLTAGKHPGLLVIITVDGYHHPLLITTVHTCGCYVAVIPTGWLDPALYPEDWPADHQSVYGEKLPARLGMITRQEQVEVVVRPEVHRVMDVRVVDRASLDQRPVVYAREGSLHSLRHLPLPHGGETSWYYRNWPLRGHVKGAVKWWEMLLLSLPSLDLLVGMDKDFGDTELTGNPFYTSLQPWYRHQSDLNNFSGFLRFQGWKL